MHSLNSLHFPFSFSTETILVFPMHVTVSVTMLRPATIESFFAGAVAHGAAPSILSPLPHTTLLLLTAAASAPGSPATPSTSAATTPIWLSVPFAPENSLVFVLLISCKFSVLTPFYWLLALPASRLLAILTQEVWLLTPSSCWQYGRSWLLSILTPSWLHWLHWLYWLRLTLIS